MTTDNDADYGRVRTVLGSGAGSTTTDGMHYFDAIIQFDHMFAMQAAWNDLPIDFDGHAFATETICVKQLFQRQGVGNIVNFAIECDFHAYILARTL